MHKASVINCLGVIIALGAAFISYKLLLKHVTGSSGSAWFEAGCTDDSGDADRPEGGSSRVAISGGANCAAVLASPYSYFPPKPEGDSRRGVHIPVALLGLMYYSVLAVWLIGVGRPSSLRRRWHIPPLLLVGAGLVGSAFYTYVMFTRLDEWCPWCMATHVLNLLLAACVVLLWPRRQRRKGLPTGEGPTATASPTPEMAHPTARLAGVTMLAVCFVLFGQYQLVAKAMFKDVALKNKNNFDRCLSALDRVRRDSDLLVENWQSGVQRTITVRDDDPVRLGSPGAGDPLEVVVFSDFECPSCKRLAGFLDEKVMPLFAGNVRVVWKHFPLNADCNPQTTTTMHKHACVAATIAEAARRVGGSEAFWRAHDAIYARQDRLKRGQLTPEEVASAIGIDPKRLSEAMQSERTSARLAADAEQGRALGVRGTPTMFLMGRWLDPVARDTIEFWDRVADLYWQKRNEPRPESARLARRPLTLDTPDPTDVP